MNDIQEVDIYTIIRQTPGPLNTTGIIAILYHTVGSRDPLHIFQRMHIAAVEGHLDSLVAQGKIDFRVRAEALYFINEER